MKTGLIGFNYLTHLDLSSNNITRIQGLEGLVSLDILNLASSKTVVIEGLLALKHDVTNSLSQQYLTIIEAVNAFRHNPKAMESSTTTSVDIHNGSLSVLYIFLLLIKKRSFL
ncbi:unnamed protein product [Rotaria sp. Silwood2]|nr:unnamed protein product [Rotaria sp. Silwood2]CAF2957021.1 unnamed protein product [Rotaria sp. Silwood2]